MASSGSTSIMSVSTADTSTKSTRRSRSSSCSLSEMPRTGPRWMRFMRRRVAGDLVLERLDDRHLAHALVGLEIRGQTRIVLLNDDARRRLTVFVRTPASSVLDGGVSGPSDRQGAGSETPDAIVVAVMPQGEARRPYPAPGRGGGPIAASLASVIAARGRGAAWRSRRAQREAHTMAELVGDEARSRACGVERGSPRLRGLERSPSLPSSLFTRADPSDISTWLRNSCSRKVASLSQ